MARAHHRLELDVRRGALHVDVRLELTAPWTVLFGPSGSGKSTILRGFCGLLDTTAKVRLLRGEDDLSALPSHLRAMAMAPQKATLFPHMSVEGNVKFPQRVCPESQQSVPQVEETASLFRLHELRSRMPGQLSGGEAQRVNLARAFAVPGAKLLLLDEPFSGLDRALRDELLPEMQAWCAARGLPVLSVTHDVEEALLLRADVVRVESGRLVAQGPAAEVLASERERMLKVLRVEVPPSLPSS